MYNYIKVWHCAVLYKDKKVGLPNSMLEKNFINSLEMFEKERAAVVLGKSKNCYVFSLRLVLIGVAQSI
jgi:hypothetical protein